MTLEGRIAGLDWRRPGLLRFHDAAGDCQGGRSRLSSTAYRPTRNFCDCRSSAQDRDHYFDPMIGAGIEAVQAEHPRRSCGGAGHSPSRCRTFRPSPLSPRQGAIVVDDNTGDAALPTVRLIRASTSASGRRPSISAVIPTSCSAPSPTQGTAADHGRDPLLASAPDRRRVPRAARSRTLAVRLAHHQQAGLEMAYGSPRGEVLRVIHPALESDPGHAIWKRDFTGRAAHSVSC